MSDNEEENFCFYGKPLDPYDEDAFPKKKPISVEEQIATDSKGRRRFHGAFTGGFSAGFFNTVGSLEGWLPAEFKSSRGDKQKHVAQNPEDFMDDEDMGEFGFAPQSLRATKDYDTTNKRKRKVFSDGPIPGEPVLHSLLTAGNETVGYLLLKNIGIEEKIKTRDEECSSNNKIYGCEIPKTALSSETLDVQDYDLPELYTQFLKNPKNDTFSLGYVGLDKSHVNLFKSSDLIVHEKNKKLSIRGQAFGVGAFENDDDDIYAKEDMSNYDFELTKEKEKLKNSLNDTGEKVFNLFVKAKINTFRREIYPPPVIPKSFTGKYKVKKSRFEPVETNESSSIDRREMNSSQRAKILDEETNETFTSSKPIPCAPQAANTRVKKEKESCENNEHVEAKSKEAPQSSKFDPSILWTDRFVTAAQDDEPTNILAPVKKYDSDHYTKEMQDAAKMKMFGPLTRISEDWQPCSLLCKRFNVPEPMTDKKSSSQHNRIKMKNLIFEYQKHREENVAFQSGLTQVSSEMTTKDQTETKSNSMPEETEVENADTNLEMPIAEIKQEVVETEDEKVQHATYNKKLQQVEIQDVDRDRVIEITDRLNIEEKEDLFRAVFLSSSESEDEEEKHEMNLYEDDNERAKIRELELKSNVLGEDTQIPKIKPLKEGILSGLHFKSNHVFTKPVNRNEVDTTETNMEITNDPNPIQTLYGPKLPENLKVNNFTSDIIKSYVDVNSDSSDDKWVEKDDLEKTKRKKQKKSKSSHRKKHKKHKKKTKE